MTPALRVVMAQLNLRVGDIDGNVQRIIEVAAQARQQQADLLVLPELSLCGYPPEDLLLRASMQRRIEAALQRLCQDVQGISLLLGLPWREGEHCYNCAVLLADGQVQARYAKQRLPNYKVFDEKRYFTAGQQPCVVEVKGVRLGLTICEDIWHAEPAAQARAAGAELLVSLNASPFHLDKQAERERMLAQRASEVALPILYVNQVGGQDELVFDGGSCVMAADGRVLQRALAFTESLEQVDCYREAGTLRVQAGACAPLPELEASVYQALVLGVRDYVRKNGFKGVLLGLSGGIDSALTLAIAVDALGAERVDAVMMPYHYTAQISLEDAEAEARTLGVNYRVLPIAPMVEAFMNTLEPVFAGRQRDTTEENLQARCRGTLLMAMSPYRVA